MDVCLNSTTSILEPVTSSRRKQGTPRVNKLAQLLIMKKLLQAKVRTAVKNPASNIFLDKKNKPRPTRTSDEAATSSPGNNCHPDFQKKL